jgi:hypothetical protein
MMASEGPAPEAIRFSGRITGGNVSHGPSAGVENPLSPWVCVTSLRDRGRILPPTDDSVSLILFEPGPAPRIYRDARSGMGNVSSGRPPIVEWMAREDLRWYLVNKYRSLLIAKLTPEDLEELQRYHRLQYDMKRGWDHEYVRKFIRKLREYIPEDILKREIAGIETVLTLVKSEDLGKDPREPQSSLS